MTLTKHGETVVLREDGEFIGIFRLVQQRTQLGKVLDFTPRVHDPIFPEFSVWEKASKCLTR